MERIKPLEKFNSYKEFEASLNEYAEKNHAVFTKHDSKKVNDENLVYKYLVMGCKHYGRKKPNKKLKYERVQQSSYKSNCPAHIALKLEKGKLVISRIHLDHNHAASPNIVKHYLERRRLTKDEIEESQAQKFIEVNVSSPQLTTHLKKFSGKNVTYQDVCNLRQKMKAEKSMGLSDTEEALAELIGLVDGDPEAVAIVGKKSLSDMGAPTVFMDLRSVTDGTSNSMREEEEEAAAAVTFLFFQSGEMRRTYNDYPEIVFMDTTYNVTKNRMPLSVIMVVDGYGVGRPVSYCFLTDELTESYEATLTCLRMSSPEAATKTGLITIDKDLSEVAAAQKVFPSALIQICEFHTLKAFRTKTAEIKDKESRDSIREVMHKLVYAETEEKFQELLEEFHSKASTEMICYLQENWISRNEAWVRYQKLIVPNFGNTTTNILESYNRCIKTHTSKSCSMAESMRGILQVHANRNDRVENLQFVAAFKTAYRTDTDDPIVQEVLNLFKPLASKILVHELSLLDKTTASDDENECACPQFKAFEMPCRHMLKRRQLNGNALFDDIAERWLVDRSSAPFDEIPDPGVNQEHLEIPNIPARPLPQTKRDKFKAALKVCSRLSDIISDCGGQQWATRMEVIEHILSLWTAGKEATIVETQSSMPLPGDVTGTPDYLSADKSASTAASPEEGYVPAPSTRPPIAAALKKLQSARLFLPKSLKVRGRPRGGSLNVIGTPKKRTGESKTKNKATKSANRAVKPARRSSAPKKKKGDTGIEASNIQVEEVQDASTLLECVLDDPLNSTSNIDLPDASTALPVPSVSADLATRDLFELSPSSRGHQPMPMTMDRLFDSNDECEMLDLVEKVSSEVGVAVEKLDDIHKPSTSNQPPSEGHHRMPLTMDGLFDSDDEREMLASVEKVRSELGAAVEKSDDIHKPSTCNQPPSDGHQPMPMTMDRLFDSNDECEMLDLVEKVSSEVGVAVEKLDDIHKPSTSNQPPSEGHHRMPLTMDSLFDSNDECEMLDCVEKVSSEVGAAVEKLDDIHKPSTSNQPPSDGLLCFSCKNPLIRYVTSQGKNKGRAYFKCATADNPKCREKFLWAPTSPMNLLRETNKRKSSPRTDGVNQLTLSCFSGFEAVTPPRRTASSFGRMIKKKNLFTP